MIAKRDVRFASPLLRIAALLSLSAAVRPEPSAGAGQQTVERPTGARVAHFAVLCTGSTHGSAQHKKWYWGSNERIYRTLRDVYGYADEAVYRLHEEGRRKDPAVDGQASLANFRKVFAHLAKAMRDGDHLLVYLVGHGGPSRGDYVYDLTDGKVTAAELGQLLDALPTPNVVLVLNPCFSGGFISRTSGKGRVVCTSTTAKESNAAGWEGYMTKALAGAEGADADGDGRVSLKEAYNASIDGTKRWYENKNRPLREHPLLDDNGDGTGHFGKDKTVKGDGELAARTFLGDEGRKLSYDESALTALGKANQALELE